MNKISALNFSLCCASSWHLDRYIFSQVVHICVHRFFVEYHRLSGSCMVNNWSSSCSTRDSSPPPSCWSWSSWIFFFCNFQQFEHIWLWDGKQQIITIGNVPYYSCKSKNTENRRDLCPDISALSNNTFLNSNFTSLNNIWVAIFICQGHINEGKLAETESMIPLIV